MVYKMSEVSIDFHSIDITLIGKGFSQQEQTILWVQFPHCEDLFISISR